MKTHGDITDPKIRRVLAAEIWIVRNVMRRHNEKMTDYWFGILVGLDTFARRLCDAKYMAKLFDSNSRS